ncbi:Inhibitor of nuclear factor kappa-B kinase subunit beta [Halotydeus destructor]|nr:Inhibitor of nuclear factor kappa-B kinase subunit beta [Halotydeus destructor]
MASHGSSSRPKPANDNEAQVENWIREAILGSGAFGVISLWKNVNTEEKVALKQCRWNAGSEQSNGAVSRQQRERWKQEVEIMHRLNHPNVVKAIKVPKCLENADSDLPVLGMEYCSGGDLRKVLSRPEYCNGLPESMVRALVSQISSALLYLHSNRIIHRDLKPENVVLQPAGQSTINFKLIDLGYCKELDQSSLASSFVGTLQYLAPELFISKQYTSAVDNWSFGLLVHETLTGRRPFLPTLSPAQWIPIVSKKKSDDISAFMNSHNKVEFSREISPFNHVCLQLKSDLEDWLRIVLQWDPKKRGSKMAFHKLNSEILKKNLVRVFVIKTLQMFAYEIRPEMRISELKVLIESNCSVPPNSQHIFIPHANGQVDLICGNEFDNDLISKHLDFGHGVSSLEHPSFPTLIMLQPNVPLQYSPYSTTSIIPPSVEEVLLNPTRLVTFEDHKNMWKAFIWVAQRLIEKFSSLSLSRDHLLRMAAVMKERITTRASSVRMKLVVLQSHADEVRKDVQLGVTKSRENNNNDVRNTKFKLFIERCERCIELVKKQEPLLRRHKELVEEIHKRTSQLKTKPEPVKIPFDPLFLEESNVQSNLHGVREDEMTMTEIYLKMLQMFNETRRRTKEDRAKHSKFVGSVNCYENTPAVKLICDLFQLIERLAKAIYAEINPVVDLIVRNHQLLTDLDQFESQVKEITDELLSSRRCLFSTLMDLMQTSGEQTDANPESNLLSLERLERHVRALAISATVERLESPQMAIRTLNALRIEPTNGISSVNSSPTLSEWSLL